MPSSPTHASSSTHHPPFARDDAQRVETENDDDDDDDDENEEDENENVVCTNSVIIIRKKKRGEKKRTDTHRTRRSIDRSRSGEIRLGFPPSLPLFAPTTGWAGTNECPTRDDDDDDDDDDERPNQPSIERGDATPVTRRRVERDRRTA